MKILIIANYSNKSGVYKEYGEIKVKDTEYKYLTEVGYPFGMHLYLSKQPFNESDKDGAFCLSNWMSEDSELCKTLWKKHSETKDKAVLKQKGTGRVEL